MSLESSVIKMTVCMLAS